MARSATLNVMVQAAMKAGRGLARDFGEVENLQVSVKGPGDFVSNADRKAEKVIFESLTKARPSYGFLGEEGTHLEGDGQHRWIVDPLDGTNNFIHSIPIFAISIGLESQGQLVAGVVYNPVMNELFTAERGNGAFMNDRRLRVSGRRQLADAAVATGVPALSKTGHAEFIAKQTGLMREVSAVRSCGSAALNLAWLAAGRYDAYWESGLKPWDIAAGIVLVREAGGVVTDTEGGSNVLASSKLLAGNEHMHGGLKKLLSANA
ncbi:MAG: inositol monophosphatase family protein [Pseudomonadota bacterium]